MCKPKQIRIFLNSSLTLRNFNYHVKLYVYFVYSNFRWSVYLVLNVVRSEQGLMRLQLKTEKKDIIRSF
jgi:hypothetical protein